MGYRELSSYLPKVAQVSFHELGAQMFVSRDMSIGRDGGATVPTHDRRAPSFTAPYQLRRLDHRFYLGRGSHRVFERVHLCFQFFHVSTRDGRGGAAAIAGQGDFQIFVRIFVRIFDVLLVSE